MYPSRAAMAGLAVLLAVAACSEGATAPSIAIDMAASTELDFNLPRLARSDLTTEDTTSPASPDILIATGRDLLAEHEMSEWEFEEEPSSDPEAASVIIDARTLVGFGDGFGFARGIHRYVGNKSRIETTVNVGYGAEVLGTQSAFQQHDVTFLAGVAEREIHALAKVYLNQPCGLTAWGSSSHSVWWEAVFGGPVSTFGSSGLSTQSDLARQAECPRPEPPSTGFGGGSGGYMLCYFWVTYDLDTGYVYEADLLYCDEAGG